MDITSLVLSKNYTDEKITRVDGERQQDNLKVATVEKELNTYKSAIANVNVNQESKQSVSGYGTISLPKNTANGQVSSSVFGNTYTNLLGIKGQSERTLPIATSDTMTDVVTAFNLPVGKYLIFYELTQTSETSGRNTPSLSGIASQYESNIIDYNKTIGRKLWKVTTTEVTTKIIWRTLNTVTDVKFKNFMIVAVSDTEYAIDSTVLLAKYPYINDTKSTVCASRLKSVGKNLFNGKLEVGALTSLGTRIVDASYMRPINYIIIKPSTTYRISRTPMTIIYINYYDENKNHISQSSSVASTSFTTPSNAKYIKFSTIGTLNDKFQLEENTVVTPYEPYKETTQYIPNVGELRSLPSAKDEVRVSGGKAEHIKRVSDEVILNGNNLASSEYTAGTNTYAFISSQSLGYFPDALGNHTLIGYCADGDFKGLSYDGEDRRGTFLLTANYRLYTHIEKSKIDAIVGATLVDKAKAYFNQYPVTLTYQLAQEIVTPIQTSGNLISYPSGTVYVENVVADAGNYTTKFDIKELQLPIKSIDKLIKYNFTTGVQTVLDTTLAVINADKKSFTHPQLVKGDMVFVDYYYDVESTLGETTIEYYDSRHTIKDTTNGKNYSWDITSTNGVPTVALTEVL